MHRKKNKSAKGAPYLGGSRGKTPRKFLNLGSWKCHLLCFPQAIFSNPLGVLCKLSSRVELFYLCTVPFKRKLTLNSRSSRESRTENRVENQFSIVASRFSIPARLTKPGMAFVEFQVICSLLLILHCSKNLQPLFKF